MPITKEDSFPMTKSGAAIGGSIGLAMKLAFIGTPGGPALMAVNFVCGLIIGGGAGYAIDNVTQGCCASNDDREAPKELREIVDVNKYTKEELDKTKKEIETLNEEAKNNNETLKIIKEESQETNKILRHTREKLAETERKLQEQALLTEQLVTGNHTVTEGYVNVIAEQTEILERQAMSIDERDAIRESVITRIQHERDQADLKRTQLIVRVQELEAALEIYRQREERSLQELRLRNGKIDRLTVKVHNLERENQRLKRKPDNQSQRELRKPTVSLLKSSGTGFFDRRSETGSTVLSEQNSAHAGPKPSNPAATRS